MFHRLNHAAGWYGAAAYDGRKYEMSGLHRNEEKHSITQVSCISVYYNGRKKQACITILDVKSAWGFGEKYLTVTTVKLLACRNYAVFIDLYRGICYNAFRYEAMQ